MGSRGAPTGESELSLEDPWLRRFKAWADERFPLAQGVLISLLYLLALLYGRALESPGAVRLAAGDVPGLLAFTAFFLMLRILDEHKDYEVDLRNYPHRILQSGLITLGQLKVLCAGLVLLQLGVSLWLEGGLGPVVYLWLAVMLWTGLMTAEFFVGAWLKQRLVLYAVCHMLVMPLAIGWIVAMASPGDPPPLGAGLAAALGFSFGSVFEIARKTRAPADERTGVDTYSKVLGPGGAAWALAAMLAATTVLVWGLLRQIQAGGAIAWTAALAALFLAGGLPSVSFARLPTPERARLMQGAAFGAPLGQLVVFNLALIAERGLLWG